MAFVSFLYQKFLCQHMLIGSEHMMSILLKHPKTTQTHKKIIFGFWHDFVRYEWN